MDLVQNEGSDTGMDRHRETGLDQENRQTRNRKVSQQCVFPFSFLSFFFFFGFVFFFVCLLGLWSEGDMLGAYPYQGEPEERPQEQEVSGPAGLEGL